MEGNRIHGGEQSLHGDGLLYEQPPHGGEG